MEKLLENESMRKKSGDQAEVNLVMDMEEMASKTPPVRLRTAPLLAVLIED